MHGRCRRAIENSDIKEEFLGAYYGGEFSHDTRAYFNEAKARETLKSELEIAIEGKTKYFLNSNGGKLFSTSFYQSENARNEAQLELA